MALLHGMNQLMAQHIPAFLGVGTELAFAEVNLLPHRIGAGLK
jgi:hypothetical protein